MSKYKTIFRKNLFLMLSLIIMISIGLILINNLKEDRYLEPVNIGGSFSLIDQNGNIYKSKKVFKKKLLYFGYTYCPDVCPFDILRLSNFINTYPSLTQTIDFVFITVDPERDTVIQIKNFLENFNPSIKGLTGEEDEIASIIKKFRIFSKKNKASSNDKNYLVDHSSLFFLIDEDDKYLAHFRPDDFNSKINDYLN